MKRSYYLIIYDNARAKTACFAMQKLITKEAGQRLLLHEMPTIEGVYGDGEVRKYRVTEKRLFTVKNDANGVETLFVICDADRIK